MVKKRCTFKNLEENLKKPGRISKNSKNLEEIQKTFGHPDWSSSPKKSNIKLSLKRTTKMLFLKNN